MHSLDRADPPPAGLTTRSHAAARALGVGAAVVAAVGVWALTVPVLGVELLVASGGAEPREVGVVAVASSSLAAALAGWGLLALLERRTTRSRPVWTMAALVVLVLSLFGPLAGVTTAATVTLTAMHVVVAGVLIPALTVRGRAPDGGAR